MRRAIVCTAVFLAGCAGAPLQVPKETRVPVAVPCRTELIPRPSFVTDGQLRAMGDADVVLSLAADRLLRQTYELKLEAALAGCL